MVGEIRIYVEGGGDAQKIKGKLRQSFHYFFEDIINKARQNRINWTIIACGSRDLAHKGFRSALNIHPEAFNVLLVDSEGPVNSSPVNHLNTKSKGKWNLPPDLNDQCHLMVQMMEAWFLADIDTLERFYGHNFRKTHIPKRDDVEAIAKQDVYAILEQATRNTRRGEYHKTRHAFKILAMLDAEKVRRKARHCERLFSVLESKLV